MAYDQFPLAVRREKPVILNDIVDNDRIALFSHDPHIAAARLARVSDDEWSIVPLEVAVVSDAYSDERCLPAARDVISGQCRCATVRFDGPQAVAHDLQLSRCCRRR